MATLYDNPPNHVQSEFLERVPEDDNELYDYDEDDESYRQAWVSPAPVGAAPESSVDASNESSDATALGPQTSEEDTRNTDSSNVRDQPQPATSAVLESVSAGPSNLPPPPPALHLDVPSVSTPASIGFAEPDCPDIGVIVFGFDTPFNLFRYHVPALLPTSVTLYQEPIGDLFKALRKDPLLRDKFADGLNEMTLSIPEMDLTLREDDSFSLKCTLQEFTILHMGFLQGKPVTFVLGESRRFKPRFLALSKEIEERALRGEWGPEFQPAVVPEPEPLSARPSDDKRSPKSAQGIVKSPVEGRGELQDSDARPAAPTTEDHADARVYAEAQMHHEVPFDSQQQEEDGLEDYDEDADYNGRGQYVQDGAYQHGDGQIVDEAHPPYTVEEDNEYGGEEGAYDDDEYDEEYYGEEYVVGEGNPDGPYFEGYGGQDGYVHVERHAVGDGSHYVDYDENVYTDDYNPEAEESNEPGEMDSMYALGEPASVGQASYHPHVGENGQEDDVLYDYDDDELQPATQESVVTQVFEQTEEGVMPEWELEEQVKTPTTAPQPDVPSQEENINILDQRDENGQPWAIDGDGHDFGVPSTPPQGGVSGASHSYDDEDLLAAPVEFDWSTPTMHATRMPEQPTTAPLSPTPAAVTGMGLRHRSPTDPSSPVSPPRATTGDVLRRSRRKRSWDEDREAADYKTDVGEIGTNLPGDTNKRLRVQ